MDPTRSVRQSLGTGNLPVVDYVSTLGALAGRHPNPACQARANDRMRLVGDCVGLDSVSTVR